MGAGGEEVGRLVAEALGFDYVDEDIVARAAERGGGSAEDGAAASGGTGPRHSVRASFRTTSGACSARRSRRWPAGAVSSSSRTRPPWRLQAATTSSACS